MEWVWTTKWSMWKCDTMQTACASTTYRRGGLHFSPCKNTEQYGIESWIKTSKIENDSRRKCRCFLAVDESLQFETISFCDLWKSWNVAARLWSCSSRNLLRFCEKGHKINLLDARINLIIAYKTRWKLLKKKKKTMYTVSIMTCVFLTKNDRMTDKKNGKINDKII